MRRNIGVSRVIDSRHCMQLYLENLHAGMVPQNEQEWVGQAAHEAAAADDKEAAWAAIEQKLEVLPEEQRQVVIRRARQMCEVAERERDPEATPECRERKMRWEFEGWEIFAKPDELFFFPDERAGGAMVMQITELKSTVRAKSWHWEQLYLFGLVASMVHNYHKPIKLVVRPMQGLPGAEEVRWYSPAETPRQLERLRGDLLRLEEAWGTRVFERRCGGWCHGCKQKTICQEGGYFLAEWEVRRAARAALAVPAA
jgi:hypothetical protein